VWGSVEEVVTVGKLRFLFVRLIRMWFSTIVTAMTIQAANNGQRGFRIYPSDSYFSQKRH
jgi:hypothetical protein